MSNFEFLKSDDVELNKLYEIAKVSEDLIYTSSNTSLMKQRQFIDVLTQVICDFEYIEFESNLFNRIDQLIEKNLIPKKLENLFHKIRKNTNPHIHDISDDSDLAIQYLSYIYNISLWFTKVYGDDDKFDENTYSFIIPDETKKIDSNELQNLKNELRELEKQKDELKSFITINKEKKERVSKESRKEKSDNFIPKDITDINSLNKKNYKSILSRLHDQKIESKNDLEKFGKNLDKLKKDVNENIKNSEKTLEPFFSKFLSDTYNYNIKANIDNIDLSIYNSSGDLKVIVEVKRPNSSEMITAKDFNKKAMHEVILYYFRAREKSNSISSIMITDTQNLYLIDVKDFNDTFYKNKDFKKIYKNYVANGDGTEQFYSDVKSKINELKDNPKSYYINLNDISVDQHNFMYKFLSPINLFNEAIINDSNILNTKFYNELIYILGLKESGDNKKVLIDGNITNSFIYDIIHNDSKKLSGSRDEVFEKAISLVITWLNRILFIKLFESKLLAIGHIEEKFLTIENITKISDLNNLFHSVLNTKDRVKSKDIVKKFGFIPYLNSSLFNKTELESNEFDLINLENNSIKISEKSVLLKDSNNDYTKDSELTLLEYLLEFLNRFSFGGKYEDRDLLINSSVLGTVFEQLNGYSDGSHYTPSTITMYMCSQSITKRVVDLFNEKYSKNIKDFDNLEKYVKNNLYDSLDFNELNSLIDNITIIDPSVGSGHFLVSSMNELIKIKSKLGLLVDSYNNQILIGISNDELDVKYSDGKHFYYEKSKDSKTINSNDLSIQKTIFETKKHIIEKQLFGVDINPNSVNICRLRLWTELLKSTYYIDKNLSELQILPNLEFKVIVANSLIPLAKNDSLVDRDLVGENKNLKKLITSYFNTQGDKDIIKKRFYEIKSRIDEMVSIGNDTILDQLKTYDPFNSTAQSEFFDSEYMFGIDKFDIVIGNPPYIRQEKIKHYKKDLEINYKIYNSTSDIYTYFFELALKLLKDDGVVSYITSNKWTRAKYGEKLRTLLLKYNITEYIDFNGVKVFDSATVDTSIITVKNSNTKTDFKYSNNFSDTRVQSVSTLSSSSFTFLTPIEQAIKDKIEKIGTPLKEWDISIYRGVLTGLNEAFIITKAKRDELIELDSKSSEIIKPLLRGRDIKRYGYEFADLYLIATFPTLKLNIDDYPAIRDYLSTFKGQIEQDGSGRKKTSNKWFETQDNIAYYEEFSKEKVVYPETTLNANFYLDINNYYIDKTCFIMVGNNLKYIISLLSSKFITYYYKLNSNGVLLGNSGYQYNKHALELLPIPKITLKEQQPFIDIVEQIIKAKEEGSDTTKLESKIDSMVYKLYNLSDDEIKVVEGS